MHNNGSDPTILSICRKNFWHSACWSIWHFFLLENVRREKCVVKTQLNLFTRWLSSSIKLTTLTFDRANRCMSHIDTIKWITTTCNSIFHWLQKVFSMAMNNTGWALAQRNCMLPLLRATHHPFFFQELFLGRYIYQGVGRRWKKTPT